MQGACVSLIALMSLGCDGLGHILSPTPVPVVRRVGPGRALSSPSAAARVVRDGDVVEIDAGTYRHDAAVWRADNLTIRGVGGRAHLQADGAYAEGKAIWVIKGANTTIDHIEFSGARVPDHNGAGIRQEGAGLTVRDCYFHDNENGILTGRNLHSDILIEQSEFANNGYGDGYTHNLYIGEVKRFTLRASYSHHARVGHDVKSRARENYILYNEITDGSNGTASYEVDLPNGGLSYLIGNVIQQGPKTENPTIISYGAEGLGSGSNELYVVNNTVVDDRRAGGRFIVVARRTQRVEIRNNIFAGSGTLPGLAQLEHNVQAADPGFVDRAGYDYHLRRESPAIDAGCPAGEGHGFSLAPVAQYVATCREEPRPVMGTLDCGAFEFVP
jgi:hypothetical protein